MKRNDPRRLREQRHKILEAAARSIAENGYHGMSMRALAKATGRSLATAYNYFSSKEEILYALQREAFEALTEAAHRALEGVVPASSRLYVFILNHISYFTVHAEVMRVLIHEAGSLPAARRRKIRKLKSGYFELGRELIEALLQEGCSKAGADGRPAEEPADPAEVERITYSLFGMLNWIYGWYEPERHGDAMALARTMHNLILCGAVTGCPLVATHGDMDRHYEELGTPPLLGGSSPTARRVR